MVVAARPPVGRPNGPRQMGMGQRQMDMGNLQMGMDARPMGIGPRQGMVATGAAIHIMNPQALTNRRFQGNTPPATVLDFEFDYRPLTLRDALGDAIKKATTNPRTAMALLTFLVIMSIMAWWFLMNVMMLKAMLGRDGGSQTLALGICKAVLWSFVNLIMGFRDADDGQI